MKLSRLVRWALVPIGVGGFQALAFADAAGSSGGPTMPDTGVSVLRVLGALVLVLGIFFAAVWMFKNSQRVLGRPGNGNRLQVLEMKSLGGRQSLYVVAYGRQRMLVGSSPSGIALVSQLPESVEDEVTAPGPSFVDALQNVLHRKS
jgi:flagellar protein FliO/FliZ